MSRTVIAVAAVLVIAAACGDDDGATETGGFVLPWPADETWFFVGGPHCDSRDDECADGALRYALDFAPRAPLTGFLCDPSENEEFWVTAAADGVVRVAGRSLVEIEHEDGLRTGYYHLRSSSLAVSEGETVAAGDRLGNPSCEHRRGGTVPGPHVHFYFCSAEDAAAVCLEDRASLLPAAGRVLSGWLVEAGRQNYAGELVRGGERRTAADAACPAEGADEACGSLRNGVSGR